MGIFDRLAGLFSAGGKSTPDLSLRGYDAGRSTRTTWAWMAGSTSANAEVYSGLVHLRNRSRDLVRNNPHASKAIRVLANNVVGTGIVATARTKDKKLNDRIDALWREFICQADFGGQHDFYGLQKLAVRAMLEGGEAVARLRVPRGAKIPLQVQLLEGDYLDHRKNFNVESGNAHLGIEFDDDGKRTAYWLFKQHPGEMPFVIPQTYVSERIQASDVLHLYESTRIGQIRGVPWLTPGMMKARELDTYEEAELVRKRIEACVAAIVVGADDETQEGITSSVVDASGNKLEQFEPGIIAIARGAKDIKFTQPAATGHYSEYKRSQLQTLAAAWDMTYEVLTGDLSQVNYSSIKAGLNEFRRSVEVLQWLTVIPLFCQPVWRCFIDRSIAAGLLPPGTPYDAEWTTPKFESVDLKKDTQGEVEAIRSFLLSPQEAIRRRGGDPDIILAEMKAWHDALKANGMVSDADPTLAPKAGAAARPAVEEDDEDEAEEETTVNPPAGPPPDDEPEED